MNTALKLPADMMDAVIVSRMTVGTSRVKENGFEPILPTRENAGLPPEGIAALDRNIPRSDIDQGIAAMKATAGKEHPLAASLSNEMQNAGIRNLQEKKHIEPSHTARLTSPKGGPERG
jgi:hypothetical protein